MKKINELFRNTYKKTELNKFLDRDGLKMCNLINVTKLLFDSLRSITYYYTNRLIITSINFVFFSHRQKLLFYH